jgi:hypothetical protein
MDKGVRARPSDRPVAGAASTAGPKSIKVFFFFLHHGEQGGGERAGGASEGDFGGGLTLPRPRAQVQ